MSVSVQIAKKTRSVHAVCTNPLGITDFLRQFPSQTPGNGSGEPGEYQNVVFDVEVDGARYVLMRFPIVPEALEAHLSPREWEIARMVAKGHSNKIIAGVLEISSWTVCAHLRRIFAKLGVATRAAMVARLNERFPSRP